MARALGIGIIGSGNISAAYLKLGPRFKGIEMRACADVNMAAAQARAKEFGVRASSVAEMLAASDIDIVVNLTVPAAHYQVTREALDAGKHVYSEKPFVLSVAEGKEIAKRAAKKGLRVGSAPDTFLGGAHQLARHLVDSGAAGAITGGTCHVMSRGMEDWHPNPDFFFKPGGGPILDLGPYYIANLVQLIGPVKRVTAMTSIPSPQRTIGSLPRRGEKIDVSTPTTIHAVLEFESGALVTLGASWDVIAHGHHPMEIYGTEASLALPDPNFFGGEVGVARRDGKTAKLPKWEHPFGVVNEEHGHGMMANYRAAGLADMAQAIVEDRPHRCALDFALHVVDVMTSILRSGETGKFVTLSTTCDRPAPLGVKEAAKLLRKTA